MMAERSGLVHASWTMVSNDSTENLGLCHPRGYNRCRFTWSPPARPCPPPVRGALQQVDPVRLGWGVVRVRGRLTHNGAHST